MLQAAAAAGTTASVETWPRLSAWRQLQLTAPTKRDAGVAGVAGNAAAAGC